MAMECLCVQHHQIVRPEHPGPVAVVWHVVVSSVDAATRAVVVVIVVAAVYDITLSIINSG